QRFGDNEPWEFYLGETVGNSFYYASEMVVTGSAIKLMGVSSDDDAVGFQALCDLSIAVSRDVVTLFQTLIADIVKCAIPDIDGQEVDIGDMPAASSRSLGFFLDDRKAYSSA